MDTNGALSLYITHLQVYVGKSGLNYSVGFIRYTKSSSSGSNYDYLIIIMPALTGVIVLMAVVLAILCCSIGITIRKKRAYKARQRWENIITHYSIMHINEWMATVGKYVAFIKKNKNVNHKI